jgi:hypothetical protein
MSTQIDTQTGYSLVVKATQDAIKSDVSSEYKWVSCAKSVVSFFGTESAIAGVKAQFIADAILPAIDKRHAQALASELPRKNSKEYNELTDSQKTLWEDTNKAKKDARSTCNTYFDRVVRYAFPSSNAGDNGAKKSELLKLQEHHITGKKIVEKSIGIDNLDIAKYHELNNQILALLAKAQPTTK